MESDDAAADEGILSWERDLFEEAGDDGTWSGGGVVMSSLFTAMKLRRLLAALRRSSRKRCTLTAGQSEAAG